MKDKKKQRGRSRRKWNVEVDCYRKEGSLNWRAPKELAKDRIRRRRKIKDNKS